MPEDTLTPEQLKQRREDARAAMRRNASRKAEAARRAGRCGCTGCLNGTDCIDPYRAGGI